MYNFICFQLIHDYCPIMISLCIHLFSHVTHEVSFCAFYHYRVLFMTFYSAFCNKKISVGVAYHLTWIWTWLLSVYFSSTAFLGAKLFQWRLLFQWIPLVDSRTELNRERESALGFRPTPSVLAIWTFEVKIWFLDILWVLRRPLGLYIFVLLASTPTKMVAEDGLSIRRRNLGP